MPSLLTSRTHITYERLGAVISARRPKIGGSRLFAIFLTISNLISNIFAIRFLAYVPDVYHIRTIFTFYLHIANICLLFGTVAAVVHHATSLRILYPCLALDALLSTLFRLTLLLVAAPLFTPLCAPPTVSDVDLLSPTPQRALTAHAAESSRCFWVMTRWVGGLAVLSVLVGFGQGFAAAEVGRWVAGLGSAGGAVVAPEEDSGQEMEVESVWKAEEGLLAR